MKSLIGNQQSKARKKEKKRKRSQNTMQTHTHTEKKRVGKRRKNVQNGRVQWRKLTKRHFSLTLTDDADAVEYRSAIYMYIVYRISHIVVAKRRNLHSLC